VRLEEREGYKSSGEGLVVRLTEDCVEREEGCRSLTRVRKSWQAMLWEEQTPTDESDGGTLNVGQAGRGRGGTTTQLVALGAPH
jgi:hypothetical protein